MKADAFKKLIKEAVKEVFDSELKELLFEALKANRTPIVETYQPPTAHTGAQKTVNSTTAPATNVKKSYMEILNEMQEGPKNPMDGEFRMPTGEVNTISEGSALPEGQLSLDQIMKLTGGK